MWEINGLSLECDIEDIETAEKVENALKKMSTTELTKTDSMVEAIKQHCNIIKQVFIDIFGTETTDNIFKDVKLNRRLYEVVFRRYPINKATPIITLCRYDIIILTKSMELVRMDRIMAIKNKVHISEWSEMVRAVCITYTKALTTTET